MTTENRLREELLAENEELRLRLEEAEETLRAIGSGEVDAFVVSGPEGEQVFTLKGAEHPYRVLVETMNEGAAILAADGTILYCNNRLAAMLQVPLESLIGTELVTYVAPADQPLFSARLGRYTEECDKDEVSMITGAGNAVPVMISCCATEPADNGNIDMVITDLTQQKRNEETKAAERLAHSIIEQAGEAIIVCDEKGRIIRASRLAHDLCGENPLLQPFDELFRLQLSETDCQFSVLTPLHGGCLENAEVSYKRSNKRTSHLLLNATPLKNDRNGIIGCVVTLSDITELKQAEEELLETNRRLEEATALAQEMAAKSEAANVVKSQFLANMSHELRTPMTGVLGMLDLVLSGNLEAQQREFIEIAKTSGSSLVRILNDILDLTKIEAGKFSIEEKPFSLRNCLANTCNIFLPVAKNKGLEFKFTVAEDLPEILVGDQIRLSQVLTNLASNAVKFTEKGMVTIRAAAGGSVTSGKREVIFTVADTGIGIPNGKKDLLFRVFSQIDESHSRCYGGAGLGLAICQGIVKRMGGTISFTSEEGQGSTFTCTIPFGEVKPVCSADIAPGKTTAPGEISADEAPAKPRLLLAEDDQTIRLVLGTMLQMAKYEVDFAENGRKVVEMWKNGTYGLILMDVQMPFMNGFEATATIRQIERNHGSHIPIIAMTAHALKEDEQRCLDAGMDAYISKPIDFMACLHLIKENLKIVREENNQPCQKGY